MLTSGHVPMRPQSLEKHLDPHLRVLLHHVGYVSDLGPPVYSSEGPSLYAGV